MMNRPKTGRDEQILGKLLVVSLEQSFEILNRMLTAPKKPLGSN